jgi:hypothetical protein
MSLMSPMGGTSVAVSFEPESPVHRTIDPTAGAELAPEKYHPSLKSSSHINVHN